MATMAGMETEEQRKAKAATGGVMATGAVGGAVGAQGSSTGGRATGSGNYTDLGKYINANMGGGAQIGQAIENKAQGIATQAEALGEAAVPKTTIVNYGQPVMAVPQPTSGHGPGGHGGGSIGVLETPATSTVTQPSRVGEIKEYQDALAMQGQIAGMPGQLGDDSRNKALFNKLFGNRSVGVNMLDNAIFRGTGSEGRTMANLNNISGSLKAKLDAIKARPDTYS